MSRDKAKRWGRVGLWVHLFVCLVWLNLMRTSQQPHELMIHIFLWSILGVQFTWGLTVGLLVGPARKDRPLLWWSLLTVFMPLYIYGAFGSAILSAYGPLIALIYMLLFAVIVASETYCGVLLGARHHTEI